MRSSPPIENREHSTTVEDVALDRSSKWSALQPHGFHEPCDQKIVTIGQRAATLSPAEADPRYG
jgi:hypothetical protein